MVRCSLCGTEVSELHREVEQFVIDWIKQQHPEWVKDDGACPKCIQYYKSLGDSVKFDGPG